MKYKIIFIILWVVFWKIGFSQTTWSSLDKATFNRYIQNIYMQESEDYFSYTILYFLNTPYKANTLEVNNEEQLVINLHALDCVTYVENVLALLQVIGKQNPLNEFENNLKKLRYRNGYIKGYLSRLHYFSDWLKDSEKKGFLKNITPSINGILYKSNVFLMSSDSQGILLKKYPQYIDSMKTIEQKINQQSFYYIPKKEVKKNISKIQTGDIISFTTNLKGLDVSHLGFALWKKDTLYIVHASSSQKKVVSNIFLNYFLSIKHFTGIIVARKI